MTEETILLLIRHGLTALGPLLIALTPITEGEWDTGAGAIMTLIGLGWSFKRKWSRQNA